MNEDILEGREIPEEEKEKIDDRVVDMDPDKLKFYEDLRRKAKDWTGQKTGKMGGKLSEYLFLLPDFFIMLTRLMLDKRVPGKRKLMVGGIVAYRWPYVNHICQSFHFPMEVYPTSELCVIAFCYEGGRVAEQGGYVS